MKKKLTILMVVIGLLLGGLAYAAGALFIMKPTLSALNATRGQHGDRAIVITDAGAVSFYYYSGARWNEATSLGAAASKALSFFLQAASNLSDLGNTTTALTNLGLATTSGPSSVSTTGNYADITAIYGDNNTAILGRPTGFLTIPVGGSTKKVPYY